MSERIEGVPVGTKLVRIGKAKMGDWYIDTSTGLTLNCGNELYDYKFPIIVPDNVYGVIDLSVVPIKYKEKLADYEIDGDTVESAYFTLQQGSGKHFISDNGVVLPVDQMSFHLFSPDADLRRIHVRKIKPKTRKVLVWEMPIGACFSEAEADRRVASSPDVYHIEERHL